MSLFSGRSLGIDPRDHSTKFDSATLIGAIAAFGLVFIAIAAGGGFLTFIDVNSLLIVVGGTIGTTLINYPLKDFFRTAAVIKPAFFDREEHAHERVQRILELSQKARSQGKLALEDEIRVESDPFLRKCIELIVDGVDPNEIKQMLELELSFLENRHRRGAQLLQTMGNTAPAMGLVGTLIGLIQMLGKMNDPSQIGPAMALALLTTFYGAVFSNMLLMPLAGKLRAKSQAEAHTKELTIDGILRIANSANPRMIEQHLFGFLPPEMRHSNYA